MKIKIKIVTILFLLFLFVIFKYIETYDDDSVKFNNIFILLEDKIRLDLTKPYIHTLSEYRSRYIYNYLFNYSKNNNIDKFSEFTLEEYLENICFVKDNNLVEPIIDKINSFLLEYYNCDTLIDKLSYVSNFKEISKRFHKFKFKNDILNFLNHTIPQTENYIIFDKIIDIMLEEQLETYYSMNIKDAIINILLDNNLISYDTNKDYDDFDILFESIDQSIINRIKNNFNFMNNTILNLSLANINNLYYSGKIDDFSFNMDFC